MIDSILSERLLLRAPQTDDLLLFHRCFEDKEAMKYYYNGFSATLDETQKKVTDLLNHWDTFGYGDWVCIEKSNNEFIGFCGFDCEIYPNDPPNLGFAFPRSKWGKGFATEAALRSIQHAFEVLNFKQIIAYVHPKNHSSIAVLQKCHMTFEKEISIHGEPRLLYNLHHPRTSTRE